MGICTVVSLLGLGLFCLWFHFYGGGGAYYHKGIKALKKQDFLAAKERFYQAAGKQPFNPWTYLNLGLSYDLSKDYNKALEYYDIVFLRLNHQKSRSGFYSVFNRAELYGRLDRLQEALENYQKALEFHYRKTRIKTNIELLFKNKKNPKKDKSGKNPKNNRSKDLKDDKNKSGENQQNEKSEESSQNESDSQTDQKKQSAYSSPPGEEPLAQGEGQDGESLNPQRAGLAEEQNPEQLK